MNRHTKGVNRIGGFISGNDWNAQYGGAYKELDEDGITVFSLDNTSEGAPNFIGLVMKHGFQVYSGDSIVVSLDYICDSVLNSTESTYGASFLWGENFPVRPTVTKPDDSLLLKIINSSSARVQMFPCEDWTRVWFKYTFNDDAIITPILRVYGGNKASFKNVQLEFGDVMTEYDLSPEDKILSSQGGVLSTGSIQI